METRDLPDWSAFHGEILTLRERYEKPDYPLLFRGLPDSDYSLTTTLERAGCDRMLFDDFYRIIHRIKDAVGTLTGNPWNIPPYSTAMERMFREERHLFDQTSPDRFPSAELYPFLVYLRHHGFPSPLLDWSLSPYVAAFFAFRNLTVDRPAKTPPNRSIYAYCEYPGLIKGGGAVGEPAMRPIGRYVRGHPRHYRQQSDYTVCAAFDTEAGWRFHPHDPVFGGRSNPQDMLWKFNLPSSEGLKILAALNEHNLNAFSLFDNEETLMETLWFREHVLRTRKS
jgi:hypothetical protein